MNKNIIVIIIIALVAIGAYFFFMSENKSVLNTNETQTENKEYIGLSTSEAEAKAQSNGVLFRVVEIDGKPQPTTRDFQEGRISAVITNGVVTHYTVETMNPTTEEGSESQSGNHDVIIGMTVTEAEAYAATNNIPFRVGTINGKGMPVTLDFRSGRITAELKNNLVIGYTVE